MKNEQEDKVNKMHFGFAKQMISTLVFFVISMGIWNIVIQFK